MAPCKRIESHVKEDYTKYRNMKYRVTILMWTFYCKGRGKMVFLSNVPVGFADAVHGCNALPESLLAEMVS